MCSITAVMGVVETQIKYSSCHQRTNLFGKSRLTPQEHNLVGNSYIVGNSCVTQTRRLAGIQKTLVTTE